ncbi:hypothetical protein QVD17_27172 [Tagetes erecta]|uniref:Bifunctional inhibitor/plant lipid transfer protein/seed storage helical domain-containing protein n=1 Tax=Tagetes erecta TaxID=13708 RepID=A0AAD8NJ53_TARER|nr:hypothetical protein QVD17_27172 [Tagetes erecta]
MMVKLSPFAFTLTVIIALSKFYAYKTTIVTAIIEDNEQETLIDSLGNPRPSQNQCPKLGPTHCYQHLSEVIKSPHDSIWTLSEILKMCCMVLKASAKQCQCHEIQLAYDAAQPKAKNEMEKKEISKRAQSLPKDCGLEVTECNKVGGHKGLVKMIVN